MIRCFCDHSGSCSTPFTGPCQADERPDGKDVFFEKYEPWTLNVMHPESETRVLGAGS